MSAAEPPTRDGPLSLAPQVPPPGWAGDSLTEMLEQIRQNHFAGWVHLPTEFRQLAGLDGLYRTLVRNLDRPQSWAAAQFVPRAQASLLAAAALGFGGFANEVYPLLRSHLEQALYAHFVSRHPHEFETWLRRDEGPKAASRMKATFTVKAVMDDLMAANVKLLSLAKTLYDRTIDYGGHPNPDGLLAQQVVTHHPERGGVTISTGYLQPGKLPNLLALRSTAQCAVCSLRIFRRVFRERFDLLGLTDKLDALAEGL